MATKPPPKRDVMLALLQQADSVYVHFDPRREGVLLPPHLKKQPRVVLHYGMNMPIPIPDLDVGVDGIGATLSFDRSPTWTFIPWAAVFAIVSQQDQRGMIWESDMPREIEIDTKKPAGRPSQGPSRIAAAKSPDARTSRPTLESATDNKPVAAIRPEAGDKSKGKKQPKRPSLRAVEGGARLPTPSSPNGSAEAPRDDRAIVKPNAESLRPVEETAPTEPLLDQARAGGDDVIVPSRPSDEIVELPRQEKKKRELPPYLRVVK